MNICYFLEVSSEKIKVSPRIVGGKQASLFPDQIVMETDDDGSQKEHRDPIPWHVAFDDDGEIVCSGVLLSNEHVLSAAHCITLLRLDGNDIVLIGANVDKREKRDSHDGHKLSGKYSIHPDYEIFSSISGDMQLLIYDFLLLWMLKPLQFCPRAFARLPTQHYDDQFLTRKTLLVSGWGNMAPVTREQGKLHNLGEEQMPTEIPNHLQFLEMPYLSNDVCQKRHKDFFDEYKDVTGVRMDTKPTHSVGMLNFMEEPGASMLCTSMCAAEDFTLCAHTHEHKGTCVGDSGGT